MLFKVVVMTSEPSYGELAYLCIYNPLLDPKELNLYNQIVFYYGGANQDIEPTPVQEQLKHIGLAQGVVEFTKYVNLVDIFI